jgi:hypothetical protein
LAIAALRGFMKKEQDGVKTSFDGLLNITLLGLDNALVTVADINGREVMRKEIENQYGAASYSFSFLCLGRASISCMSLPTASMQ